jgi:hypothetical protein
MPEMLGVKSFAPGGGDWARQFDCPATLSKTSRAVKFKKKPFLRSCVSTTGSARIYRNIFEKGMRKTFFVTLCKHHRGALEYIEIYSFFGKTTFSFYF